MLVIFIPIHERVFGLDRTSTTSFDCTTSVNDDFLSKKCKRLMKENEFLHKQCESLKKELHQLKRTTIRKCLLFRLIFFSVNCSID